MPTPSPHGAGGSHSLNSSCPDEQAPRSPSSSWHAPPQPPPPPYHPSETEDERRPHASTTARFALTANMSPSVQSTNDGPSREPESMLPNQDTDDPHKQTDTDEEMAGSSQEGGRAMARFEIGDAVAWQPLGAGAGSGTSARRRRPGHGAPDIPSPASAEGDKLEDPGAVGDLGWAEDWGACTSMGYDYSSLRLIPTSPSSFLRPGSRFVGTQQSERQVYDVQVEIKHVDLRESFLCGYLRIQGLTEDHPTLTTYFEGEIIGTKYGFTTKHETWGANERIDMSHWAKFGAFRQFAKQAKKGAGGSGVVIKEHAQKENIFMRWKEHFLVPDHRVRTIHGASFEGFYYICFNQVEGRVHGIYFHSKSEKFQQLELKHVEDRGCFGALEFR